MPFAIKTKIEGLEDLVKRLRTVRPALAKRYLRSAMRGSASIVNKAAKQAVAVGETGQLKRSLGAKVKVYPSGIVLGVVEPRSGFRVALPASKRSGLVKVRYHNPRAIAHLVERGTKTRLKRGQMPAKPFLEPAFSANEGKIVQIFSEEIEKALESL